MSSTSDPTRGSLVSPSPTADQTSPTTTSPSADEHHSRDRDEERGEVVDEECLDQYKRGGFHPVRLRELYNGRYLVLRKLGFGLYSTVWLVADLNVPHHSHDRYFAMKVLASRHCTSETAVMECEILHHLRDADPDHEGYRWVCHLIDDFVHDGPNGRHVCLVFPLMGETLQTFVTRFDCWVVPVETMKRLTIQLLLALKYAHDHGVIHTDIKPDNIFVRIAADPSVIERRFLPGSAEDIIGPDEPYRVIRSCSLREFCIRDERDLASVQVALGDWGIATWAADHLSENIEPVALRSPEVLLEAGWDERTDLWNLGCIVFEVFRYRCLFVPYRGVEAQRRRVVSVSEHLHQITRFFGPVPARLMQRANQTLVARLLRPDGTVRGEPFGHIDADLGSDYWMGEESTDFTRSERDLFVSFLRFMMRPDPDDRPSIEQLLWHRWLAYYLPPRRSLGVANRGEYEGARPVERPFRV